MENSRLKTFMKLLIIGFAMGSADVVPGVSGGTIAYISGIYQKLITAIKSFTTDVLELMFRGEFIKAIKNIHYGFLIPLGCGAVFAVLTLASFLEHSLEEYPVLVYAFFFGLVVASIYLIAKDIRKLSFVEFSILLLSMILAYLFVGLVPSQAPASAFMLFISGAIAISVMVLPGISGSFMLLILGQYRNITVALSNFDFSVLIPFILGIGFGLLLFVKVVTFLFNRYGKLTILFLLGLMIGSLRKIWPYKIQEFIPNGTSQPTIVEFNIVPSINTDLYLSIGFMLLGASLIIIFEKISKSKRDESIIEEKT